MPKTAVPRRSQGFTLVELIAVIVVLGILAAYIVPRYTGFMDTALSASARSAASEGVTRLQGASKLYMLDTSHPPASLADISNATYLNLGTGNMVNVGSFILKFTEVGGATPQVTIQVLDGSGASTVYTQTVDWP